MKNLFTIYFTFSLFLINCCPACISKAVKFQLIDDDNNKITDPTITVIEPNNNSYTLIIGTTEEFFNYAVSDSIITISGYPGTYSFIIKKRGFKDIRLDNIKIKSDGKPSCKLAKPEYFKLKLIKINDSDKNDTGGIIIDRKTTKCCQ